MVEWRYLSFLDSRVADTLAGEVEALVTEGEEVAVVGVTGGMAEAGAAGSTEPEGIASDEDWVPKQKAATG